MLIELENLKKWLWINLRVSITCSVEEFEKICDFLDVESIIVSEGSRVNQLVTRKRLGSILQWVDDGMRKELLFRCLRRKGYSFSRRTLDRDLLLLEADGKITVVTKIGGAGGTTSIINLIK